MQVFAAVIWRCDYGKSGSVWPARIGSDGSAGGIRRRAFCLGFTDTAIGAVLICSRRAVSFEICLRRNAITSSRMNTQDLPMRVPGNSPLRAYCMTVSLSAWRSAAASSALRVMSSRIFVLFLPDKRVGPAASAVHALHLDFHHLVLLTDWGGGRCIGSGRDRGHDASGSVKKSRLTIGPIRAPHNGFGIPNARIWSSRKATANDRTSTNF